MKLIDGIFVFIEIGPNIFCAEDILYEAGGYDFPAKLFIIHLHLPNNDAKLVVDIQQRR